MEAMIVQLKRLKVNEVEMSRGEFMLFSKPTQERFRAARAQFDAAGIRCVSYYTATIHDEAELETAMDGARLLGASNITGDATGDMLPRGIGKIAEVTRELIRIGYRRLVAIEYEKEGPVKDDVRQEVEFVRKLIGSVRWHQGAGPAFGNVDDGDQGWVLRRASGNV